VKRSRRRRYYYEIHLRGRVVVDGVGLFSGMLEAEQRVDERALEVVLQTGRGYRGAVIMRLGWKKRKC